MIYDSVNDLSNFHLGFDGVAPGGGSDSGDDTPLVCLCKLL